MVIKPKVSVIVKRKQKFYWIALLLFALNLYCLNVYMQLPKIEELAGLRILVITLFNFPLLILTIFIALAPLMYRKRFEQTSYHIGEDTIEIHHQQDIKEISFQEIETIGITQNSAIIWCDKGSRRYDLEGLTSEHIEVMQALEAHLQTKMTS